MAIYERPAARVAVECERPIYRGRAFCRIYICDAEVCERARARALCWMKEAG